jgi:hypothetical protein
LMKTGKANILGEGSVVWGKKGALENN